MISAALDIQGERAHQSLGESSTISVPGSRQINVPGTKTLAPVASQNPNKKKVLFVTSEIADLVKTGGLGDVSAALPRAMAHLHDVRVLIPGIRKWCTAKTRFTSSASWVATPRCHLARSVVWTCPMVW